MVIVLIFRILSCFVGTWNDGVIVLSIFEFYFKFFLFKYLCEIMSNKFELKSRLSTINDKNYVKSLDSH